MQALSGTYFTLIAQSLFANRLLSTIKTTYPNLDPSHVLNVGTSEIQHVFRGDDLTAVLDSYMIGLRAVFAFSLATSALTVLIALAIPFRRLPDHSVKNKEEVEEKALDIKS
jgi:MFS transporter, DHA2 family, glioxin efflux transporter